MTKRKQKKMQQSKEKTYEICLNGLRKAPPPMHVIPRESNGSVVSVQVCVELTRSGGQFHFFLIDG